MRHSCLATVLVAVALTAAVAAAPVRTHDIVPEDYLDIASITSVVIVPEGCQAARTKGR